MNYKETPPLNIADKQWVDELVYNYIVCLCLRVYVDAASTAVIDKMMSNYENNLDVERDQDLLNSLEMAYQENQENMAQIKLLLQTAKFKY